LHGDFQSQGQYSFFHLSFNEVLKNDWLFHFFEEMKKENIKIFGTQELKKFKYNPNKASFCKNQLRIDWFDMKIEVVFGDQTVSLKEIQKAVLKNRIM
jgi:non-specific serine/threonine protein kinase